MSARRIVIPAGTQRVIEFTTTYSQDWSDPAKRGQNIQASEVQSARFLLKKRLSDADADALITKTIGSGITVTTGKVSVTLQPDDSDDLEGQHYATLRIYLQGGIVVDWEDEKYGDVPYIAVEFDPGAVNATS
jgi:hypothetical protein